MKVHTCDTCDQARPFDGFDSCLSCAIAYEIHAENGSTMKTWQRLWAGTEWLAKVEREYARQMNAVAFLARECA